jgi:cation diffusion facilitator CzcD-associated flavoprotein CzcO
VLQGKERLLKAGERAAWGGGEAGGGGVAEAARLAGRQADWVRLWWRAGRTNEEEEEVGVEWTDRLSSMVSAGQQHQSLLSIGSVT